MPRFAPLPGQLDQWALKRRACKWPRLSNVVARLMRKLSMASCTLDEALNLLKDLSTVKFPETVDVAVNLGIDPRKSDQLSVVQRRFLKVPASR